MFQYVVRRLVYGLITLLALSIITFTLLQNTGGDPLDRLKSNPRITQETVQEMAEFYGLDQPATQQYLTWAGNFVQFWNYPTAWGRSFQGPQQVQEMVINRLGGTARLMFTALFLAVMIGIPLGIYQAIRQYSFFDQATTTFSFVTFSTRPARVSETASSISWLAGCSCRETAPYSRMRTSGSGSRRKSLTSAPGRRGPVL